MGKPQKNIEKKINEALTSIENSEENVDIEKKIKKVSSEKKKDISFNKLFIAGVFTSIFNSFSLFVKSEKKYTIDDFKTESDSLYNLSLKYKIIINVFDMISPLTLLFSLFQKFVDVTSNIRRPQHNQQNPTGSVENVQNNNT